MKKLLLFIALTIFRLGLNAQSVGDETTIDYDGYSLKFKITSVEPAECEMSGYTDSPTDVIIPSAVTISGIECSVTSIGSSVFENCSSLTSIKIPNSITSIKGYAFFGCSSLTSIEIPNSVTSIGFRVFEKCSSLTSIEIPNSVTSIGERAFYSCESLINIEIPNSVTSIEKDAFSGCSSLTSIEIPNSVTSIGESAFFGCSSLINIVVVEGNAIYDSRENCNAIIETTNNILITGCQNTTIPNSVTSIGRYAFGGSNITSIKIPNSVTSIEWGAFQVCSNLTNIEISDNVTSIEGTFYNCNKLKSVIFGENSKLTSIGNRAFLYCSVLTNIDIPKSVTSIGEWAFGGCTNLASINIPESVNQIDSKAFAQCTNLSRVKCYATSVPSSPEDIFNSVPKDMTIQVPETSIDLYLDATPWKDYTITSGFNNKIEATSNMNKLGSVSGGGIYDDGEIVTLKATIKGDNEFEYWTEGGIIVSKDTIYSFTATRDRNIIGNFRKNDIPKNVMATAIDSNTIKIRWDKIVTIQSYNVYRNGEFLKNVSENSYLDEGLIAGTEYCYTITSIRDNGDESKISEEVCAKTLGESINELSSSINIYPNPVENELFIATEVRVEKIAIYDIYGRQTISLQVNETTSQQVVEVADLEAGVYFVNVVTNAGEIVKRFVKK